MNWSDVTKPPSDRTLRQFSGLWLVFFLLAAALRWHRGHADGWTAVIAAMAVIVGTVGLVAPALVKPIYVGWMAAAFPIGWTMSRVILTAMFYVVLTPIAWVFRIAGRDALGRHRAPHDSYWTRPRDPRDPADYFRQS